ncbi:MAG: 1-phosphofructokinase [Eubacteriales bacterium]|nr:1-phosphofructokinase [Eubacteriales bacterium]
MIITVTLNPAVDRTMHVPKFCAGRVNRATAARVDAGGKGINVSKALKELGCESVACGLIAGRYGRMIKEQLTASGIKYDFVEVPGETRLNIKIISDDGTHTDINEPGFAVSEADFDRLIERVEKNARRDAIVVLSGSVPPNLALSAYERLCGTIAARPGVRLIVDADGVHLRAALASHPVYIKPNVSELASVLGYEPATIPQIVDGARKMIELGAQNVAVSMGGEGAVVVSDTRALLVKPPKVPVVGPVGAGDVMVAAIAQAVEDNNDFESLARYSAAAGTASVTIEGTRMASRRTVLQIFEKTEAVEL